MVGVAERGEPDDGSRYYHHWQAVLERLVLEKGLLDSSALMRRKGEWAATLLMASPWNFAKLRRTLIRIPPDSR